MLLRRNDFEEVLLFYLFHTLSPHVFTRKLIYLFPTNIHPTVMHFKKVRRATSYFLLFQLFDFFCLADFVDSRKALQSFRAQITLKIGVAQSF